MYMYMYMYIDMQLQNHTNTIIKPKRQTKERLRDHTMNNHEQSTISGAPGLQDQDRFWRTNGNWEKKNDTSPYKIQQDKILEASNPPDTAQLAASLFFTEPRPSNEPRQCWPKPRNAKRIKIQNTHPGRLLAIPDFKLDTVVAFSGGISSDICSLQIEVRTAAEHAQSWTTSMSRCQQYWCDLGCVLVTGFNVFDEKNNESQKVQCVKSFFDNWSEQDWILCVSLFFWCSSQPSFHVSLTSAIPLIIPTHALWPG